jgi:hypothetical protein
MNNTYFKSLFLLFGLLFVIGCQEDNLNENPTDEANQQQKLFISYKNMAESLKDESALDKAIHKIQSNSKDQSSSLYNFSFDENKVQVMQDSAYTQYTFLIKRDDPTYDVVENYICRVFDNDSVDQYITTYPIIETQDSIYVDYTTGSITAIDDGTISFGKSGVGFSGCVPELIPVEVCEVISRCTHPAGNHASPSNCSCTVGPGCDPPVLDCHTEYFTSIDCSHVGGSSDDNSDPIDDGQNDSSQQPTTGGGVVTSDPTDEQEIITKPEEPEMLLKQPVRDFIENLDDTKKDCYENGELNDMGTGTGSGLNSMIDDIDSFLNQNTVNGVLDPEAAAFVEAILEDCDSDQEVDLEEKIILDSTFVDHDRLKCVYNKFKSGNNTISGYLDNFLPDNSTGHLNFKADSDFAVTFPDETDAGAITDPPVNGADGSNVAPYNIDIIFNTDSSLDSSAENFPTIILAQWLIHEMVHAEMYRKLLECANLPHVNYDGYTNDQWENFVYSLRHNYEGLYDYFFRYKYFEENGEVIPIEGPTQEQHQQMAAHYRSMVVNALKGFDNNQHSDAFYNAIAWIGLKETVAWDDPSVDQDQINNLINFAIDNETHDCTN